MGSASGPFGCWWNLMPVERAIPAVLSGELLYSSCSLSVACPVPPATQPRLSHAQEPVCVSGVSSMSGVSASARVGQQMGKHWRSNLAM